MGKTKNPKREGDMVRIAFKNPKIGKHKSWVYQTMLRYANDLQSVNHLCTVPKYWLTELRSRDIDYFIVNENGVVSVGGTNVDSEERKRFVEYVEFYYKLFMGIFTPDIKGMLEEHGVWKEFITTFSKKIDRELMAEIQEMLKNFGRND